MTTICIILLYFAIGVAYNEQQYFKSYDRVQIHVNRLCRKFPNKDRSKLEKKFHFIIVAKGTLMWPYLLLCDILSK